MKTAADYIKEYSITKETASKYYEIRPGGQKMQVLSDLISGENIATILTEHDQEIKDMIDEMEEKSKEEEERMIAKLMKDKQMEDADGWRACYLYYRMALRGIRSKL